MSDEKVILYGPKTGKSLLRSYPELAQDPVFKNLPADELLFAWYMGIPNSPVDTEWSDHIRHKSAAARAFTSNKAKAEQFSTGNIPEEVRAAIKQFSKFSPEARLAALKMTETIFSKYMEMVNVDVKKDFIEIDKDGNTSINFTARKSYIDSMAKVREELPMLIKQIEDGYGVTDGKKNEEQKFGQKAIDKYHQNKKK